MIADELQIKLHLLYEITGVPFIILNRKGTFITAFPQQYMHYYLSSYSRHIPETPPENLHENGIRIFYIGSSYFATLTNLTNDLYVVTVPMTSMLQESAISFPLFSREIKPEALAQFYQEVASLPTIRTMKLAKIVSYIKLIFTGNYVTEIDVVNYDNQKKIPITDIAETDITHNMSAVENLNQDIERHAALQQKAAILNSIECGNENRLKMQLVNASGIYTEQMSFHPVRQIKYTFISLLHDGCMASISGGLSENQAFRIYEHYCQRMDMLQDIISIQNFINNCLMDFCNRVHKSQYAKIYNYYTKNAAITLITTSMKNCAWKIWRICLELTGTR